MTALTIKLPDREAERLRALAEKLGVSPEDWVTDAVRERLDRAKDFDTTAERVVEKNAELYRRLS